MTLPRLSRLALLETDRAVAELRDACELPIIRDYEPGLFGSCQRPGCHKAPTKQVSTRWSGWFKVACDEHANEMAVSPTLTPCPGILRSRCSVEVHSPDDCPTR